MLTEECCTSSEREKRMLNRALRPALLVLALAAAACEPQRMVFCDLVRSPTLFDRYVRVEAVGVFSFHGSYLTHPDCPTASVLWGGSRAFERDPSSGVLRRAINDLALDTTMRATADPDALGVDVTGRFRLRDGRSHFVADRVHSVRRTPRVYGSDMQRQAWRCEFGPHTSVDPEETRRACEAYEALRAQANEPAP